MITDHPARPGPGYWDWRCLTCSEPVAAHAGALCLAYVLAVAAARG